MRIVFQKDLSSGGYEPIYKEMTFVPRIGDLVCMWDSMYVVCDVILLAPQGNFKQRFDVIVKLGEQREYHRLLRENNF